MKLSVKNTFFILLLLIIVIPSCKEEEVGEFDNETTSELLFNSIKSIQLRMDRTTVGGEMGACWVQHFAKIQYSDEALHSTRESVIRDIWKGNYKYTITRAKILGDRADAEGNNQLKGASLVLEAYAYSILTDLFGNIPFENIEEGDDLIPQADVYNGIIDKLKEASALFDNGGSIDASADILYDGNSEGWKKLANSLLFRSLMRISFKVDVTEELQGLLASGYLFSSIDEECKLEYGADISETYPMHETIVGDGREEWKIHQSLTNILNDNHDPRRAVYAQKNDYDMYGGSISGNYYDNANLVSSIGLHYLDENMYGYWMSYSELMFLIAEAGERGMLEVDVEYYYYEGIKASFVMNNLDLSLYEIYITKPGVRYNDISGLRQIGIQNWIALYSQGIEAWTEWRRTGFPYLYPTYGSFTNEIPSRLPYPSDLKRLNGDNYIHTLNEQGVDELTTKLWWME